MSIAPISPLFPCMSFLIEGLLSRFTMCRVTEKDIKTFCTQDPSLHL